MNKKIIWIVVLLVIVVIAVVAATTKNTSDHVIKVGVITPLTGPIADYGEEIKKGVTDGAVPGVQLLFEDEKCDPKEGVSAFQKLTDFQKVNFIIGPTCGTPQEAVVPLLKNKEIISLVPAAASSDLFSQSGENFFNIQYSLQDESKFLAEKMYEMGYRNVALISYGTAFSQTHADSFRKSFKGKIAYDSMITNPESDVSSEIAKVGKANVDAIYSPDISLFFANGVAKLQQYKINVPVFSTYVVELPAARSFVSNVFYSYPADLGGAEGAVYGLSKQASALLTKAAVDCQGRYQCVKDNLVSSGLFDQYGVYKRPIILKQIKNSVPTVVSQ